MAKQLETGVISKILVLTRNKLFFLSHIYYKHMIHGY